MNLKQLWSIFRGRRTNFSWMNASWTYYPDGDPMSQRANHSKAWDSLEPVAIQGVGRDAENEKSLCFYFDRKPTDDEMRYLHEMMQRAVTLQRS